MSRPGPDYEEVASDVWLHRSARLDVTDFEAGPGTVINSHARVFGTRVRLGRECWIDEYATIGGGSAFDPAAFLEAGDWLHLGNYSQVNTARGVRLGDEVGIGIGSRVFTHGAWLSEWDGYPALFDSITIGSRVWLPNALVNPGVVIGDDVVVAAGSVVSSSLPSGVMAAGNPAKVVRSMPVGRKTTKGHRARVLARLAAEIEDLTGGTCAVSAEQGTLRVGGALFIFDDRVVTGQADEATEKARNQLRRHGIRFRYEVVDGAYRAWSERLRDQPG